MYLVFLTSILYNCTLQETDNVSVEKCGVLERKIKLLSLQRDADNNRYARQIENLTRQLCAQKNY